MDCSSQKMIVDEKKGTPLCAASAGQPQSHKAGVFVAERSMLPMRVQVAPSRRQATLVRCVTQLNNTLVRARTVVLSFASIEQVRQRAHLGIGDRGAWDAGIPFVSTVQYWLRDCWYRIVRWRSTSRSINNVASGYISGVVIFVDRSGSNSTSSSVSWSLTHDERKIVRSSPKAALLTR